MAAIAAAACSYNGPSGGACRAPALAHQATTLLAAVDAALAKRDAELEELEALAGGSDSDGGGSGGSDRDPAPILPVGFEHDVRFTDAKPHGWAEYKICCPKHGEKRVDRLTKLAAFFGVHAACRPEWHGYARAPRETDADHLERLRPTFTFYKAHGASGPPPPLPVLTAAAAAPPRLFVDPPSPTLRRPSAALLASAALAGTGTCPPALARSLGAVCDGLLAAAGELAAAESAAPPRQAPLALAVAASPTRRPARRQAGAVVGQRAGWVGRRVAHAAAAGGGRRGRRAPGRAPSRRGRPRGCRPARRLPPGRLPLPAG